MQDEKYTELFKTLSDPNRLKILGLIKDQKDICACDLLKSIDVTQPTLAHHMKVLIDSNLISCEKNGVWCHYSINKKACEELSKYISDFANEEEN